MTSRFTLTQISPDHPVVWEDETTIRVGFDRAHARVTASSPASQAVIAKLVRGATMAELAESGSRVVDRVVADLSPVLRSANIAPAVPPRQRGPGRDTHGFPAFAPPATLRSAPRLPASATLLLAAEARARAAGKLGAGSPSGAGSVSRPAEPGSPFEGQRALVARLSDDGREVPGLRAALGGPGGCDLGRTRARPDLAIEVHRFLEPLGRTARWLRAGVPHLMIRFTDDAARVGPLVAADGAPCHGCEGLHLTDADPALPAIAAQLYGTAASSETAEIAQLAAAVAVHFIGAWRRRERWVHDRQLVMPVAAGSLSAFPRLDRIRTHAECGCAISAPPRPPPRTVTAPERLGPRSQTQTATARRVRG